MKAPTKLSEAPLVAETAQLTPVSGITLGNPIIYKIGKLCVISTAVTPSSEKNFTNFYITESWPTGFNPSGPNPSAMLATSSNSITGKADFYKDTGIKINTTGSVTWLNLVGFYICE